MERSRPRCEGRDEHFWCWRLVFDFRCHTVTHWIASGVTLSLIGRRPVAGLGQPSRLVVQILQRPRLCVSLCILK